MTDKDRDALKTEMLRDIHLGVNQQLDMIRNTAMPAEEKAAILAWGEEVKFLLRNFDKDSSGGREQWKIVVAKLTAFQQAYLTIYQENIPSGETGDRGAENLPDWLKN